jgi:hypothetical protein
MMEGRRRGRGREDVEKWKTMGKPREKAALLIGRCSAAGKSR